MTHMQFQLGKHRRKAYWTQKLLFPLMLALGWGQGMSSTIAAQTVTIRLGPFQQSVALADLEKFAKTGRLPEGLEILSPVLTSQVRELLTKRLEVNPAVADRFIDNLMRSLEVDSSYHPWAESYQVVQPKVLKQP